MFSRILAAGSQIKVGRLIGGHLIKRFGCILISLLFVGMLRDGSVSHKFNRKFV